MTKLVFLGALAISVAVFAQDKPVLNKAVINEAALKARFSEELVVPVAISKEERLRRAEMNTRLKDFMVFDLKRRDLKGELPVEFEKGKVEMLAGKLNQVVIKPQRIETKILSTSGVVELPGVIAVNSRSDPTASGGDPDSFELFRLTFLASPLPAVWDFEKNSYSTKVTFGLKSVSGGGVSPQLDEPVEVRVAFDGLLGKEPDPLIIAGVGLSQEESFILDFKPTTAEPKLMVRSSISDVDLELKAVSRISLQATREEVLGLGLEDVVFDVNEFLPHGEPVVNDVEVPVLVSVSGRARVEPEQPSFAAGAASTQFRVRSSGLGAIEVSTRVGDSVAIATVQQRFPFTAIVAVLFGGAIGGFSRRFVKGAHSIKSTRWVVEGIVVSLVAFVAGVLGVSTLGIPSAVVATEAGAFLTGVLSGFVGVVFLEKLTSSLGGR